MAEPQTPVSEAVTTEVDPNDNRLAYQSKAYSRYVLGILVVVYIFNFIDRQILTILLQPIKEDLQVSDAWLGFLVGTAFALFYATLGIPIARLADRSSRTVIIAIALGLWSFMTALSGLVTTFWQLALARIGVAVGEAGCSPPAHSIIADIFDPKRRATALAVYSTGIPIGGMIGLIAGGAVSEAYGWRQAFFLVGIPGLLLAILFFFTVKEPPRGMSEQRQGKASAPPSILSVWQVLKQQKSFFHLAFAASLHAFVGYGLAAFSAAYLERQWGGDGGIITRTEIGWYLGTISGISGMFGILFGGAVSDYLSKYTRRWYMWLPAIAMGISFPFYLAAFSAPTWPLLLLLLIVPSFAGNLYAGPSFAATQSLVPLRMRAVAAAILLFIINIIGLGLGPQLVGVLSDMLNWLVYGGDDAESLRVALICVSAIKMWAALHFWLAGRTLESDLDRVPELEESVAAPPTAVSTSS